MFKFRLNKEEHDALDDATKAFYSADGDNFVLQVEGAVSKDKLDEFRQSNVELLKKAKATEGVDLEKYNSMLETERKIRDKELIDKGDFDTLVSERTKNIANDYQAKLENATAQVSGFESKYNQLVSKHEIEGAALKAFGAHNIRPDAHSAVLAQIKSTFVVDNGSVIAKNGDSIITGVDGNLTIDEFVGNQPDFMRVPNTAGAGNGDESNNGMSNGNSSRDKITSGLQALMKK
jgi:hypothetical protein